MNGVLQDNTNGKKLAHECGEIVLFIFVEMAVDGRLWQCSMNDILKVEISE